MSEHEQHEYAIQLGKLRKKGNFLFLIGMIMIITLNICLVRTFISSQYDLSLLVLGMYIVHDLAFKNAMNGITADIKEIKEKLGDAEGEE